MAAFCFTLNKRGELFMDIFSTYILTLFPEGFHPLDMLRTVVYLIGIVMILALLIRLIHKKASKYNHALSSAMALMFMYLLMILLHKVIPQIVDPVLDKLPLIDVNFEAGTISLFQFSDMRFTQSCLELVYVLILSFCLIGLDDLIPDARNVGTWMLLQFIIACIAMAIYCFVLNCINTFSPEILTSYAPMVLICVLLFMVFLGILKVLLGLVLMAVNPLLVAVGAFFSSNKLGMALGKSVMCSFVMVVATALLKYKGLTVVALSDLTFLVCLVPLVVLALLWVVIGHIL